MIRSFQALPLVLMFALSGTAQVKSPHVVLHTDVGDIELELDAVHAPETTANFLRYVNAGMYTGGSFFRVVTMQNQPQSPVKIEVIQGSTNPARKAELYPAVPLERTNKTGLHHLDGTVSMGRNGPDTAQSVYFHLHRGTAGAGLWREAESGWAGVRGVRQGGARDGCGEEDTGAAG